MFLSWRTNGESQPSQQPTIDGAIAFWSSKDPFETYEWSRADICACGQYAKFLGDKSWMARNDRRTLATWETLNAAASFEPRTFGALIGRLKSGKHYEMV